MKKTLVRLLSVILAAVMVFPAAAFATDGKSKTVKLWCGTTQENTYSIANDVTLSEVTTFAKSGDGGISLNEETGVVTAEKAGSVTLTAIHTDETATSILFVWYFEITKRSAQSIAVTKTPNKWKDYVSGETFDPTGMVITVTYNNGETGTVDLSTCKFTPDPLTAGTNEVTITWGELKTTTPVIVGENVVTEVSIYYAPQQAYVGEKLLDLDIQVLVTWADGSSGIMETGWDAVPSGALTKDDTSFYVTFQNVKSKNRAIRVVDKPSEGGGGNGGNGGGNGGETTPEEYTLTAVTSALKKKSYNVGDTFEPDGLVVQVRNKAGVLVTSLTGLTGTNALILDVPYVFTSSDISPTTGTTKTSTIILTIWYNNKPYQVPVSGLTVTVAKKNLSVKTSGNAIRNLYVEMKDKHYPIGTTVEIGDIYRISGYDANDKDFIIYYPETLEYGNISLEVLTVNTRGETTRKSSNKTRIDSADVYTKATDEKVVNLRLYVDDVYYHDFEVSSGEPAVSVYLSSAYSSSYLLGTFDDLAEALDYVNDVNYQWGSTSASVYTASRTMYLKLAEDADLNRYYVIPARNFEIDLNGHKLTMYTDAFRFRDRNDTYTATLTNTSSTTAKVSYTDLPADDLLVPLVDKGEKLVFKYQESSTANAPGIYTVTIAEIKEGGAVTAKPAASTRNNVTTVTIAHGNDITFTVTPNKDFQIDTVKTKTGTSAEQTVSNATTSNSNYSLNTSTGTATYTMKDVKADTTLTAAFKAVKKEEEKKEEQKPAETPWTNPFTDVRSTASYYDAVKYVNQNGLMDGMTSTTFGPDRTMTRAQFVTVLGRMFLGSLGVPNLETTTQKYESMLGTYGIVSQFTDVSNDDPTLKNWAVPYIIWAEREGLVQGMGNGKFDPQGAITHQQMYIIMYRYAQYIAHQTINPSSLPSLRATDADKIGEGWKSEAKEGAIAAAKYAQQKNFLVSSVVIDPAGNALRNELAILLMQFSKNVLGWE